MQENVVVVAESGCAGLLDLVKKRKSEVGEIEEELETLREALVKVEERISFR
jgi:hypothetical protein